MELNPHNGLPVLPDGYVWLVREGTTEDRRVTISINKGLVSHNSYTGESNTDWETVVNVKWHWLVRHAAKRLYRKAVKDGAVQNKPVPKFERWDERYDNIRNYRLDQVARASEH